jgi:ABC-2 type transport system permease protein
MWATLLLHLAGVSLIGEPGVFSAVVGPRLFLLFFVLGPLVSLVSLQLAVIVSSRVNDPRSAQQLSALVILPITAVFMTQLIGEFVLGIATILAAAAALMAINTVLLWFGVRLFDRERILMHWK